MLLGMETFSYHLSFQAGKMDVFDFIERCAKFGLDGVQINTEAPHQGHLRQVVPIGADLGIHIAVENHEYETAEEVLNIVRQVDSEWVGTHVDIGNSMMVWEEPVAAVAALAPYAVSSHFKDHIIIREDEEPLVAGVALGTGSIDCGECFRILAEESPLERIIIEVCYAYSAPFRRPHSGNCSRRWS